MGSVHSASAFQTDRYREQQTTSLEQAARVLEQSHVNPTSKLFMTPGKAGIMALLRRHGVPHFSVCP
jgi:hypothetical protein